MSAPCFGEPVAFLRLHERGLSGCAGRNSAAVSLRTFSRLSCGTKARITGSCGSL